MNGFTRLLLGYLVVMSVMSPVTFVVYAWDKWRATRDGWRVSEKTLHLLEFLGGWPGAWAAQRWVRHKSRKKSYRRVFWLIVAVHITGVAAAAWWFVGR
ncbi:MAG: DUF1294 domain-containing protein [Planctomycetota bacterium]